MEYKYVFVVNEKKEKIYKKIRTSSFSYINRREHFRNSRVTNCRRNYIVVYFLI